MIEDMKNRSEEQIELAVNHVEGFEPGAFMRQIMNDDGSTSLYLDVKFRMLWFRLKYPDGQISPEIVEVNDKYAIVSCKIYTKKTDEKCQYIGKSYAQRYASDERFGDRYLEIAETAAVGRALAAAGFGTQFCAAEIPNDILDAPVDQNLLSGDEELGGTAQKTVVHELGATCLTPERNMSSKNTIQRCNAKTLDDMASAERVTMVSYKDMKTVEEMVNAMTITDAENVMVDFGKYRGSTLGKIAMFNPADLQWYVNHYNGANMEVKAGSIVLVNAAKQMAC